MSAFPSALELLQIALNHKVHFLWLAHITLAIWAFSRGAAPEKTVATLLTVALFSNRFYYEMMGNGFALSGVDMWSLFTDSLLAIGLFAVALHGNRIYPLWIAGLQLICLLAHFARAVAPDIDLLAYAILVMAPFYGQLLALALGMRAHRRRVARHGKYPSWRSSSFLSQAAAQTR